MIGFVCLCAVVGLMVLWVRRRAARKRALSGTTSERPVFSVEPPTRRMHKLKDGRL